MVSFSVYGVVYYSFLAHKMKKKEKGKEKIAMSNGHDADASVTLERIKWKRGEKKEGKNSWTVNRHQTSGCIVEGN